MQAIDLRAIDAEIERRELWSEARRIAPAAPLPVFTVLALRLAQARSNNPDLSLTAFLAAQERDAPTDEG